MVLRSLATALAFALAPACAWAVGMPSPDRLARLQASCDSVGRVRVVTRRASFEVTHPSLNSNGVRVSPLRGRAALVTIGDAHEPERRIPWDEVERMDVGTPHMWRGGLIGLGIGAGLGGSLVAASGPDLEREGDGVVAWFAVALALTTGVVGLLVGASSIHWVALYP